MLQQNIAEEQQSSSVISDPAAPKPRLSERIQLSNSSAARNDIPSSEDPTPETKEKEKEKIEEKSDTIRENMVQNAVRFLSHDSVKEATMTRKIAFLESKGLSSAEISEAIRRANSPAASSPSPSPSPSPTFSNPPAISPFPMNPSAPAGIPGGYQPPYSKTGSLSHSLFCNRVTIYSSALQSFHPISSSSSSPYASLSTADSAASCTTKKQWFFTFQNCFLFCDGLSWSCGGTPVYHTKI